MTQKHPPSRLRSRVSIKGTSQMNMIMRSDMHFMLSNFIGKIS